MALARSSTVGRRGERRKRFCNAALCTPIREEAATVAAARSIAGEGGQRNRAPCDLPHQRSMTASCPRPHQNHPSFDDAAGALPRGRRGGVAVVCRISSYRHRRRDAAAVYRSSRYSHDTRNTASAAAAAGVAAAAAVEVAGA